MFCINDRVLYGTDGVCIVDDITEKDLSGEKVKYYVLKPVYQNTLTIYVPFNNEKLLSKMRNVLTVGEINDLIKSIPDQKDIWIEDDNQRRGKYREILASGDREMLVRLIRTLYNLKIEKQSVKKRLHKADENFLNEAEKLLYNEFALVLKIEPEQVIPFISGQLELAEMSEKV